MSNKSQQQGIAAAPSPAGLIMLPLVVEAMKVKKTEDSGLMTDDSPSVPLT